MCGNHNPCDQKYGMPFFSSFIPLPTQALEWQQAFACFYKKGLSTLRRFFRLYPVNRLY